MSVPETYKLGTRITVSTEFHDENDALVDPTVAGFYEKPDGTIVTVDPGDITNPSTGIYEFDIDPDAAGTWAYRFEGTGTYRIANEFEFFVARSKFH